MNAYGVIRTFGVVVLLVAVSVRSDSDSEFPKIHELMTDDEIANVFHTTRDNIPQYVVAPVSHNRYKRADQKLRVQFTAFGEVMDAYLNPSDGQLIGENTPVWLAFTNPDGTIEYKKMEEGIVGRMTSRFFTSGKNLTMVAVHSVNGAGPSFDGLIGDLIIRPVPKRLQGETRSRRNSENTNASRTMLDTHDHFIIKSTSVAEQAAKIREASRSVNASRVKRSDQKVIYPSLLVQTDFKRLKTTHDDADYYDEIIYQLAFWNGVDLRFRQVLDPKIRIRIAGIIIGLDRNAILGKVAANKTEALDELRKYWYKMSQRPDFPLEAYDIVMTMTDSEMFRNQGSIIAIGDKSFCMPPSNDRYHAVGVLRDDRSFKGIVHAAYSLGTIFGLAADTASGDECDASNGFIMRPDVTVGPHYLEWSPCSLKSLSIGLRQSYIDCSDKPAGFYPPGQAIRKPLPGDVLSTEKQCRARGYDGACSPSPDMCSELQCVGSGWAAVTNGWWCKDTGPAAEGTACAPGRKCVDGVCQCMTAECMYCTAETSD